MDLNKIYRPIKEDLEKVEEEIKSRISPGDQYLKPLKEYVLKSKGKLLRPVLVLLSAKSINHKSSTIDCQLIHVACAIELIHTASLLHDDVLDNGKIRRHRPTINDKWGNKTAILFGDYLYSLAFPILANYQEINNILSSVTLEMIEGEIIHNFRRDDLNLTEKEYIQIITKKSAFLFASSCQIGAILAGAEPKQQDALSQYGNNLGIAYQILDDLLDMVGKEEDVGKSLRSDLAQGKITLPVIYLRDISPVLLQYHPLVNIKKVTTRVCEKIHEYLDKAKKALNIIPDSTYKKSLKTLLISFKADICQRSSR